LVFRGDRFHSSELLQQAHHEALVHPGMLAHDEAIRVAILGDGGSATLREVLKHECVEDVILVGYDEEVVEFFRRWMPSWDDCGDIEDDLHLPLVPSCLEDRFVRLVTERDKGTWLESAEELDVVILDDLRDDNALVLEVTFWEALYQSLSTNGILVLPLGKSPSPENHIQFLHKYQTVMELLQSHLGMKKIHIYEESHASYFNAPQTNLIACKSKHCSIDFFSNSAQTQVLLHSKISPTHSGLPPLLHFDGAVQKSYQTPHKVMEKLHCSLDPKPLDCQLVHDYKTVVNVPIAGFFVG